MVISDKRKGMKQNWVRAINISEVYLQSVSKCKCIGISDTNLNSIRRQKFFLVKFNDNIFSEAG